MLDAFEAIVVVLSAVGASVVQRVSGFGFGIFIMMILPYLMPSYAEATALSGMLAATMSLVVVVRRFSRVAWRRLLPILLAFMVSSYWAIGVVAVWDPALMRRVFGVVLVGLSVYFFVFSDRVRVRPTLFVQLLMGVLSGVMGGLFAMQGPPAVLYFVASEPDKEDYMVMTQCYFLIGNVFMTLFRGVNGFVTSAVLDGYVCALVGVFVGAWVGRAVFDVVPVSTLRRVVFAFMAISGILAVAG